MRRGKRTLQERSAHEFRRSKASFPEKVNGRRAGRNAIYTKLEWGNWGGNVLTLELLRITRISNPQTGEYRDLSEKGVEREHYNWTIGTCNGGGGRGEGGSYAISKREDLLLFVSPKMAGKHGRSFPVR